jgi:CMP-N-acetylneuraminic acid synthetase
LAASKAKSVDEVFVSTDCLEIEETVRSFEFEVKILKRPIKLADDTATTESVVYHFYENIKFDNVFTIQATSPLLKSSFLDEGFSEFNEKSLDTLISVNILKQFLWNRSGKPLNYDPHNRKRRQDFDGELVENGSFYISTRKTIKNTGTRFGEKVGFYEIPYYYGSEIDDHFDFKYVEKLMEILQD